MNVRDLLARPALGFDLLRVYLGIGLTVRGALIAGDPQLLNQLVDSQHWIIPMFIGHSVVLAHVVGGLLLALGCGTRLAAAVQIPPVAGALFVFHWHDGLFARSQSFEFAALVLVALILYALFGSGDLSVDAAVARARALGKTSEPRPALLRDLEWHPQPAGAAAMAGGAAELGPEMALSGQAAVDRGAWEAGEGPRAGLEAQAESPRVRRSYRDVKLEMALVAMMVCVLFALLASELYVAATAWMIVTVITFGVWRIGRAPFR